MALNIRPGVKQVQKQALTPALRQVMELLQMSVLELSERITQELEENPVLEELDNQASEPGTDLLSVNLSADETQIGRIEECERNFCDSSDTGIVGERETERQRDYLENLTARPESLTEHLLWQARSSCKDSEEYTLYEKIITSLDGNGFIPQGPDEFATENGLPAEKVRSAFSDIRTFDPVGCTARDVKDSLLIQSRHYFPDDPMLHEIIGQHFDDLERLDYEKIAREINLPAKRIVEKGQALQLLDPYPGTRFSGAPVRYMVPDLEAGIVEGEIVISLKDDFLPRLGLSGYYLGLLRKKSIEKNISDYIQDKLRSAKSFMKNLSGRKEMILKIAAVIMEHQRNFLLRGP